MKNKFLSLFICIFFFPLLLSATHIIGGSLTYQQQGVSTYRVTLKVYRDCAAGNAAFDNTITIEVLQANGSPFAPSKNITINIGTITKLNPYVDTCVAKPNVCVEEAIYTKVVSNLPPFAGGYHLFWQRCCRNGSLLNITNPLAAGESFYTHIPDNNLLINNTSPTWVNSPPTFVCQGHPINFNHAATDADGDSLVYKFYDPYVGCDGTTVQSPNCPTAYPTFPGNIATFSTIAWTGGYSTNNPLGGAGLTLSPTGLLNGIPPSIGQFVVGVKCEEWRNGVKIGEILRDFQFNVVNCPPISTPNFTSAGNCSGTAVTFTNTTSPVANNYMWDFGNTATLTDTSHLTNPTYTYPALGTYTVTLISNKGTACADTTIHTVFVSSVTPNFTSNTAGCIGLPVTFKDGSTTAAGSSLTSWSWKFGDAGTSTLQNPTHIYNAAGTYTVTLIVTSSAGCKDSIKHTVVIKALPVPNFTTSNLCKGTVVSFINTTAPAATTYLWDFGNTASLTDTSLLTNPTYTYPSVGTYTVTLVLNKGTACEITFKKAITLSSVTANFTDNGPGCIGMVVNFTDGSTASGNSSITNWAWNFGDGGISPLQNPSHTYIASGTYTVTLVVTSATGCKDTITHPLVIQNTPNPNFNATGVCNGKTIKFTNTTVPPGGSYFWDFGNPASLNDTSHSTNPSYTYPAIGTYTVTLVVNKGTACSLTFTKTIILSSVKANFTSTSTSCVGTIINFTDGSTVSNSTISGWNWNFGDGGTSPLKNPSHAYGSAGTYNVRLIVTSAAGCKDTINHSITIQKQPKANGGNDTTSCANNPSIHLTGTILNATGGKWIGNGSFTPNDSSLNPIYTPSGPAIKNGKDTVLFITTGNGSCPPDTDKVFITFYAGPTVNAGSNIFVCKDTVSVPVCATITGATGGKWKTLGSGKFVDSLQKCTSYIPSKADTTAGSVIVYITSTGNGNCFATRDSVLITFTGTPVVTITSKDSACSNGPVPFSVTVSTGSGKWSSNGTGIFSPSDTSLSGTYKLSTADSAAGKVRLIFKSSNNGGCRVTSDTINIQLSSPSKINAGSDITVCKDTASVPVCATTIVATGVKWKTLGSGTFANPNLKCTSYFPSTADTSAGSVILYITSTGNGSCAASHDSVTIKFTNKPRTDITSNDSACANSPFVIAVNSTTGKGIWSSNGTGTFSPSNTSLNGFYIPSAGDNATGKVRLIFSSTNNGSCKTSTDTINVILIPAPTAAFGYTTVCSESPVLFTDNSTPLGTIVSWKWNFGDSTTSTSKNPSHFYKKGGVYPVSLIVKSNNGCIDTITKTINVYDKPIADFNAVSNCLNNNGTQFLDGSTVNGSTITLWNWTFGDLTGGSNSKNPVHNYASSGNYLVTLIVQSAQGCIDTVAKSITLSPRPTANFIVDDYTAQVNQTVHFTDQSKITIVSWYWNFGDKSSDSTSTLQNPSHIYRVGGFFDVCLIVTDINGCKDTVCHTEVVSLPPVVPKGFTPNGDGHNDIFYVYGGPFKKLNVKLYNNWGELIFESDSQANGWDGKRNGVDQAIGVYVWTVTGVTEDDQQFELSGDVTLLR